MEASISTDLRHQGLPVTVRLQVWHYNERGRCPQFNHELARLFSPKALGDWNYWTAYPAEVVEPLDISIRDHYVPVEVDFIHGVATYNGSIGNPESGVRDIFNKFAPPIVYEYFVSVIQSPPHAMNIYALANGETIADKHILMKYTHAFFFIPLELRLKRFIKPAVICQEDVIKDMWVRTIYRIDKPVTWDRLQAGVDSLPMLGSLILAYMVYQGGQIPKGSEFLANSRAILNELSSRLPWLRSMLDKLGGADEEDSCGTLQPEKANGGNAVVLLNNASVSFEGLRGLAVGYEARIGESLTNQSILTAMLDLRQATLYLSDYERAMVSLNDGEIIKWHGKVSDHRTTAIQAGLATIGFAALTALAFLNKPLAQYLAGVVAAGPSLSGVPPSAVAPAVGVVGTVASGCATVDQYMKMNKSLATLKEVQKAASDGRVALQRFFKALRQTQAALALDYMEQVMRLPMECMGDDEREQAFKMLGADLQFLGNVVYRKTLVKDRIENLLEAGRTLQDAYQGTMDAMNGVMDTVGVVEESSE